MTTCDTNILFPAVEASHKDHVRARAALESQVANSDFALCELVLMEVYTLLRNPVTSASPLSASHAARKMQSLGRGNCNARPEKSVRRLLNWEGMVYSQRRWFRALDARGFSQREKRYLGRESAPQKLEPKIRKGPSLRFEDSAHDHNEKRGLCLMIEVSESYSTKNSGEPERFVESFSG